MPIHNSEIAAKFETLADLLEIEGANPFRVRAYREAARVVQDHAKGMAGMVERDEDLSELPGVGDDLAGKIAEIVRTGSLSLLDEVSARVPVELAQLTRIDGLGPKRVQALYRSLDVHGIDDLRHAVRDGRVRELDGFGEKTEQKIRQGLEAFADGERRTPLAEAEYIAQALAGYLRGVDGVKRLEVAGSFRRRKETVGDLDIVVTAKRGSPVMDRFVDYDEVEEVVSRGGTRSTVRLRSGMQVDLRVVPEVGFGAALIYFTGSKAHGIRLRKIALDRGWKLNEYGVFDGDERIAGRTEEDVYERLGLDWMPPELREDRGEVEAARDGGLPRLVSVEDIRGDLHCHTDETDGHDDLETMVDAARARGYHYLAITDHSRHVSVARGMDEQRLRRQLERIDELNASLDDFVVLKSIELDILEDGSLDLPDSVLDELDLVLCSVHYKFDLPRDRQTGRILRAMDNRRVNILAHPSGRLIGERSGYDVDMERLLDGAHERGCCLEVNSQPHRLDLDDTHCRMAKEVGVKLAISTDAHSVHQLDNIRLGVGQARRGWLEASDVLNTLDTAELRRALKH
jgi:DNA polymerase (family 10)